MTDTPHNILKKYWNYDQFRPLQEEIIQSVLEGKDTLALMPTGGGKSICFQVPGLCRDGICLVVSPLIALMKDQVENLRRRNIPAVAVYSGMSYAEIDRLLDNCVYGNIKFLYLSPERLSTDLAQERIRRMHVNLIAVDEAHCISQWGYDFRPPYLEIAKIRELTPESPVLALTATATPEVVDDIQEKLAFREKRVLQKSFARQNLAYVVLREEGKEEKLLDILKKINGSGVVYVRNRRKTKELAQLLLKNGIPADFYHAGLDTDTRSGKQDAWINDQIRIMVSTNAFGMGIDKPDVRIVVHMELPDNLENYFQEAGRGGRDGKKSYAVLLYNDSDRLRLEKNFEVSFPSLKEIRQVYRALGSFFQLAIGSGQGESFDFDIIQFTQQYQLDPVKTLHCLKALEQANWIVLSEAVYIPSSLKILVSKDDLYDYELRHPKLDRIIKSILRSYQGAFQHYIHLREQQLARFLKISHQELTQSLKRMQQDGIVDYRPQTDHPQLVFVEERIDANNLTIDHKLLEFRKQRTRERLKQAILYAENEQCRSQQLLAYFGEKDTGPCGICDVCTGRHQKDLSGEEFRKYQSKIRQLLQWEPLTPGQIIESFAPRHQNKIIKTLDYLLDEEIIKKDGDKLRWKS